MTAYTMNPKDVKLGDLVTSSKGAKSIPITVFGNILDWQPIGEYVPCFEPSAFNDPEASRVNISLMTSTTGIETELNLLDAHICALLTKDSQKYFGQILTEAQVKERMQPSVRVSAQGHRSWKLKMNITGRAKCVCYDENREVRAAPESWMDCSLRPHILVKSVWLMTKEFGIVYELAAAQICESVKRCPFK
jgi:hypothetical protein